MKPRIIFLPGAAGDARFWQPVSKRLPGDFEKVLMDWPGLGNVPPCPRVRGFDDLLRLTLDEMDRDVVLVAQSMGGVVAVLAALARPERVQRLVLSATSGGVDVHRFGASDWRPDYRCEYPHAAAWIFDVSVDLSHQLTAITAPTLLMWGDADPISPVTVGKHLATLLPQAELVVISGGDHAFARDRADEVAGHIVRHLGDGCGAGYCCI